MITTRKFAVLLAAVIAAVGATHPAEARIKLNTVPITWLTEYRHLCTTCPQDSIYARLDTTGGISADTSRAISVQDLVPPPYTAASGDTGRVVIARLFFVSDSSVVPAGMRVTLNVQGLATSAGVTTSNTARTVPPGISLTAGAQNIPNTGLVTASQTATISGRFWSVPIYAYTPSAVQVAGAGLIAESQTPNALFWPYWRVILGLTTAGGRNWSTTASWGQVRGYLVYYTDTP